jgi:hypothetical protein
VQNDAPPPVLLGRAGVQTGADRHPELPDPEQGPEVATELLGVDVHRTHQAGPAP